MSLNVSDDMRRGAPPPHQSFRLAPVRDERTDHTSVRARLSSNRSHDSWIYVLVLQRGGCLGIGAPRSDVHRS